MTQIELKAKAFERIKTIIKANDVECFDDEYLLGYVDAVIDCTDFACNNLADDRPFGSVTIHAATDEVDE